MNFVDRSIQLQVEVSEENPSVASNIVPEERSNHPHLQQTWVILYSRPSDLVIWKQAGTAQDALRSALETIERHVPPEWEKGKKHFRPPSLPDVQADDLEDMGVVIGEVYDETFIEECLDQGQESPWRIGEFK